MNYISLFSSAGVGCYGFKQEDFDGVATLELIKRRLDVQRVNNRMKYENGYVLGDISENEVKSKLYSAVNFYKIKEKKKDIDAIIFTAPCQGMSVANHKKNDGTLEKNSLVVEALEVIEHIKPKFFIAENVRSFMNTECIDHNERKKIKDAFKDWLCDDYRYDSKVLNFKNYGANSSRTRTLVIGVRKDLSREIMSESLFPSIEREKNLFEVIGDLPSLKDMGGFCENDIYHNFKSYREDMRRWIHDVKPGFSAFDNNELDKRPHTVTKEGKISLNVNKNGDKYTRQSWEKVAPCVHTRNDIMASQNTVHPVDDRVFSIRELMRMMNIPKTFKWTNKSEKELNKLTKNEKNKFLKENEINIRKSIGEAVPTIIMQKIAKNIKDAMNEVERKNSKETYKEL